QQPVLMGHVPGVPLGTPRRVEQRHLHHVDHPRASGLACAGRSRISSWHPSRRARSTPMDYRIISADCHIDMTWMPGDRWVKNAPAKWRDQVPQVRDSSDGPKWYAEEKELGVFGGLGFGFDRVQRNFSKHVEKMFEVGFYEGGPHPTTPSLRRKDQVLDGIDAEVMYGILGIGQRLKDPELIQLVYETYNTWAGDFCKNDPQRFVGLACLPNHDPAAAARELRRAAGLGLKGADFAVGTAVYPIWHAAWDPLWDAAQECRIPISFHTVGYAVREPADEAMAKEYNLRYRATRTTMFQIGAASTWPASSSPARSIASRASSSCWA